MNHPRWRAGIAFLVVAGVVGLSHAKDEDEPVYNNIPAERLEKILTGLKFEFKKVPGKKEMVDYYDLKGDGVSLRMHNYSGQDLWLESVFTEKLSLEDVNRWNTRAKYSRAVMLKKAEHPTVSLEAQLDCIGGVTDAIVRNYITRFQTDVAAFTKFAGKK